MPNYAPLIAKWSTLSGTTPQKLAAINALTVSQPADTAGVAVKGVLYARGSWARVRLFAAQALVANNAAQNAAWVIAQNLVEQANADEPVPMTNVAVAAQVEADLATLAAYKLADGKGVIWAAGEYGTGDPGDGAVLVASLGTTQVPWWQSAGYTSPIGEGDLAAAGGLT